jgi:quercetin dioxygenase-like cupin family protein
MDVPVHFDDLPWESPSPGVRFKTLVRGAQRLRLLEFAEGFEEPDWCTKGHAFYVLEGSLTLRTKNGETRINAGDVGFLSAGAGDAHKAILGQKERARLLLFEIL